MNVFLIAAVTQDGFIGRRADDRAFDWTSEEDTRFYIDSIKKADAIVMGATTFKGVKRHPKNSHYVIYSRSPNDFVNPRPEVITAEATTLSPVELIEKLKEEGRKNISISGGASIYKMFIESGVVDVVYLTVEPVEFGEGILLFKDKSLSEALQSFDLISEKPLNDQGTILQEWRAKGKEK